ncbi:MAG: ABC transporter ATP-binding protein [Chloroflexi bacterium OHK40]
MRSRQLDQRPTARLASPGALALLLRPEAFRSVSWGRVLAYLRPYRWWMIAALVAMLGASAVGLILPLAVGQLVNALVAAGGINLGALVLGLMAVVAVQGLFSLVQSYALSFVGERVVSDLRVEAYRHLQRLSIGFFSNQRTGELTSRITNDVTLIQTTVTSNLASLLQGLIQFVGALALMIAVSWQLSTMALLLVPAVTVLGMVFGRLIRRISTEVQDRLADASSVLEETVSGVRVVQSFGREPYEVERFGAAVEDTFRAAMRRARIRAIFQPLWVLCAWGAMVGVLWFGGNLVLSGQLRPGDLIAFLFYAGSIGGTMMTFASLFGQLQEALGAVTRVFELLDTEPEIVDRLGAVELGEVQGRVTFEDVSFAYREGQGTRGAAEQEATTMPPSPASPPAVPSVLRNLSLRIEPGEVLALVGPSGAGKSTIANLIPRFYDVQDGSVQIDGHDVRDVTLTSLRRQIGIVPQETLLFSGSVGENIRYGRLEADGAAIEAAARAANAHDFIMALPQGYDTPVGERGVKLSGGQRQRVAIARAILKDPRILILDEATSALDSESEHLVQQAIERLMRGRTSIIIAHRLSTIKRADRIAVIVAGELRELGSHAELIAQGGLYARLYAMQFRADDRDMLPLLAGLAAA